MKPPDPRRLARLLAVRRAAGRKAEMALARAAAAALAARDGEARVRRALAGTAAGTGNVPAHDLVARAGLAALLAPAFDHARARASAGESALQAARSSVAAARVARDTVESRLQAARRARQEETDRRLLLELPPPRKPRP